MPKLNFYSNREGKLLQEKEGHPHMQDCLLIPAQAQDWNKSKKGKIKEDGKSLRNYGSCKLNLGPSGILKCVIFRTNPPPRSDFAKLAEILCFPSTTTPSPSHPPRSYYSKDLWNPIPGVPHLVKILSTPTYLVIVEVFYFYVVYIH